MKADICAALTGLLTLGLASATSFGDIFDLLDRHPNVRRIRLAIDADFRTKKNVVRALKALWLKLTGRGLEVRIEVWDGDKAKGIDDALAAEVPINLLSTEESEQQIEAACKALGVGENEVPPADGDGADERPESVPVNEAVNDPHRLARGLLRERYTRQGLDGPEWTLAFQQDVWSEWEGGAFHEKHECDIRAVVTAFCKAEFDRANRDAVLRHRQQSADEKSAPPDAVRVTQGLIRDVLNALQSICLVPANVQSPAWIRGADGPPLSQCIFTPSEIGHLPSIVAGEPDAFWPTSPLCLNRWALPFGIDMAASQPGQWLRFLSELFPDAESILALQEFFGYSIVPDNSQQKILVLIGPPRSGKSTIGTVLTALVGPTNVANPTLSSLGTNFGLAPLIGKSLAIIPDAHLTGRADAVAIAETLKSVSGGDCQTIDRKFRSPLTCRLTTRFVILANEVPQLPDTSGALANRLLVLRLTRSFLGKEDTALASKLVEELPGILLWAIRGWERLRSRGRFVQPETSTGLLETLSELSSPISAFVAERCVLDPKASIPISDLFAAWKSWCAQQGNMAPATIQVFGRDLIAAVPQLEISRPRTADQSRTRFYVGIKLRTLGKPAVNDVRDRHKGKCLGNSPVHDWSAIGPRLVRSWSAM